MAKKKLSGEKTSRVHRGSLVIVESPAKARTIQTFLGKGYTVSSSMGHIKNLPDRKLGVDVEHDFEPTYNIIKGKKQIVKNLKSEARKSFQVLLAADADREGETICAHLAEEIHPVNKNIFRITLRNGKQIFLAFGTFQKFGNFLRLALMMKR